VTTLQSARRWLGFDTVVVQKSLLVAEERYVDEVVTRLDERFAIDENGECAEPGLIAGTYKLVQWRDISKKLTQVLYDTFVHSFNDHRVRIQADFNAWVDDSSTPIMVARPDTLSKELDVALVLTCH